MGRLSDLVDGISIEPTAVLDIALTALLFYGLFSLIQGTRAVRLVIGAIVLYGVYVLAQWLDLRLLSGILQTGAVVGLLALVVIFQPELRRGLERIGRVGSMGWVFAPSGAAGLAEGMARTLARTAAALSARPHRRAHRHRTGDGPGGHRRDRGDAPRRPERGAAGVDLRAGHGPPRRRRHRARRSHPGRGRRAAAVRDLGPSRALRHPPSGGHRGHGADRRGGHRGQRGDRLHRPRRAGPDVARPRRGATADGARGVARPDPVGAGRAAAGISALGAPFVRGKRPRVPRRRRGRTPDARSWRRATGRAGAGDGWRGGIERGRRRHPPAPGVRPEAAAAATPDAAVSRSAGGAE